MDADVYKGRHSRSVRPVSYPLTVRSWPRSRQEQGSQREAVAAPAALDNNSEREASMDTMLVAAIINEDNTNRRRTRKNRKQVSIKIVGTPPVASNSKPPLTLILLTHSFEILENKEIDGVL